MTYTTDERGNLFQDLPEPPTREEILEKKVECYLSIVDGQVKRILDLKNWLRLVLHQYKQVCDDNNICGWPGMVKSVEAVLSDELLGSPDEDE
jgi:hypothetical protein